MRAMVYRGPYKVRVEDKPMPTIEHPNDAIVRVTMAAICGSDLHLFHGMMPDTRVGMTFGHEFIGVVERVGPSVQNLKAGDRVMVPFNVYCGSCYFCARGLYSNCHNVNPNATAVGGIYGYSHTCGGYDGGQAEFVRVPFADVGPSIIPDWMDDEDALLCTDALATGYFAAKLKLQGGSPIALNWAIDSVRKGGTVSVMGAYGPMFSAVKFGDAMNKGLTLRMNQCPVKRQWPRLFSHIQNGYLKPNDIVTHRIPLDHIADGYHIFSAKLDGCIKPIILPRAS
ncbi:alcohol dehydrogenase catalytic domain-containing protein [Mycolicibacterium sp. P9-22]|uniref:alcohol dehydrogenase catalytic domain-containing protein n=1 Tax=Mycolicibacterium sp. P9-22 TaxID=2024613 RepID=UPI0011EFAAFA|nr:alcohol dehydrogenase catalytic domain-containing protein [Mycolicibacterium sp. P9-22]KAA0114121.1 hypothetical protein CIW51_22395 [Mycolicibacterium sp. P9-22]